ncbi:glutamyl-tRNA(Gln) amidotransferase subunit B, mitochondrial [Venturia canescens]|uniref:glutamyl-tRNA(Gln) amidotransferase subunit B, mitochondrial n=1 Tax=Venturia canescens TaxID=32260 RepID=UPI001C9C7672|nr:glutamyl-tRNA(Gln) amidotransferase subunit B, mitochondrial [Venturia canescens]
MTVFKKYNTIVRFSAELRTYATQTKPEAKILHKWNSVVGLEIHAQINAESKLFSGASTNFGMPINSCVSLFDCATPGTLPVLNRRCVEAGVLTALALSCNLNEISLFDRKHYFYADLPAGYQITQQRQPLAVDGTFNFRVYTPGIHKEPYLKSSKIKQIQLEQDSGKSLHDDLLKKSLIDLNRAGIPLMELVFEPDLSDGEEAAALVKELALILRRLNTCSCKMEEGGLRVDANISVNRHGEALGVRTEIKNIGSIRGVATAIKYEIKRQIKLLDAGGKIVNETLTWDAETQKTVSMRDKEEKQDYRFMPEPNLPPLHIHMQENQENLENLVDVNYLKSTLPEMPEESRMKLEKNFDLTPQYAIILVNEETLLRLFNDVMCENPKRSSKRVANILIMELLTALNRKNVKPENCMINANQIGDLVDLLESKTINSNIVKQTLAELMEHPEKMPSQIVEENDWVQINDDKKLTELCQDVIDRNEKIVKLYKAGKTKVLKAFLGEIARITNERANMGRVKEILEELLK